LIKTTTCCSRKYPYYPPQKGFPGEVGVGGMGFGRPKK